MLLQAGVSVDSWATCASFRHVNKRTDTFVRFAAICPKSLKQDMASDHHYPTHATRVVLDCGLDEARLEQGDIEMPGGAIELVIPWQFAPGTCIQMTFKQSGSGRIVQAETMVAESQPCPRRPGRFLTTLLVLQAEGSGQAEHGATSHLPCEQAISLCALL